MELVTACSIGVASAAGIVLPPLPMPRWASACCSEQHTITVPVLQDAEMGLCILRDVAAGINYLHHAQPPIVHTMLKPRKIMLDANYRGQLVAMPFSEVGLHRMCTGSSLMPSFQAVQSGAGAST